jgi:hypothetical protein
MSPSHLNLHDAKRMFNHSGTIFHRFTPIYSHSSAVFIYNTDLPVWCDGVPVSSRAMHEAVFEAGWQSEPRMPHHRKRVSANYQGKGRHTLSIDWTYAHHPRGFEIDGVKNGFDYAKGGYGRFQTVLTATVANAKRPDGIEVERPPPAELPKEKAYLKATAGPDDDNRPAARERRLERLHYQAHRQAYRHITEIAVDVVRQIEDEGPFPEADYAVDNGVLSLNLTRLIEERDQYWTSELEASRHLNWRGEWRRIDEVAAELKEQHPQSFRRIEYQTGAGETTIGWGFSQAVRRKRYGNKRLLMVHQEEDLNDKPRCLVTKALHGEAKRRRTRWSYRWPGELFHEFSKPSAGFEAAPVRKEEAVKRHVRWSCVAPTL